MSVPATTRPGGDDERARLDDLLVELSSRFVNVAPGDVDREITEAQRRIGESLGIDLLALWQWSDPAPGRFVATHYYIRQRGPQLPEDLKQEDYLWFLQQLVSGRTVVVPSVEALPPDASRDRDACRRLGIKSNLTLPLAVGGGRPFGILGLNTLEAERDWPDAIVKRLALVAQVFANAIARKRADEEIDAHLRFEALLAQLSSRFINLAPGDVDREISDALRRLSGVLGIDFALVWQFNPERPGVLVATHSHPPLEALQLRDPPEQGLYPWVVGQISKGQAVVLPRLDDLPADAVTDLESARRAGIRSNVTIPLLAGGSAPLGALACNTLATERAWPDEVLSRLRLVAEVFSNALTRKHQELELRASEALNRATFEQAAVGIAHVGLDGSWLRVNDRLCAIVGYSREELLRLTFQDITHPADLEGDLEYVAKILAGVIETYSMEKRYVRKDRSVVWVNLTVSLVRNAAGEPRHFISVVEDITARRQAADALRASETRLESASELAGLAFYQVDFERGTAYVDDRFREICGMPPDSDGGLWPLQFWLSHLHPDDRDRVMDDRDRLHGGKVERLEIEYRFLNPVRGEVWLHHIGRVAERDAAGRRLRTFGVLRDVTERRRGEDALKRSYAEIERLKERLEAERDYLKGEVRVAHAQGGITGKSAAIQKVLRQVEQVASTDSAVLMLGETGTGKELLAQAIHRLSPRARNVMVKVNCAALPSGLVESELFGREKGAFTGALARQVGRFEVADGSTLFLDEVGELPADVQVKLLRVLQEGEFERLGSPRTIKVNVRVIAATNKDLAEEVRKGRFREDLYYRLNVFPIRMPPLRDRPQDIPLLVWEFLADFSTRMGKKITQVPRATMEALQQHAWPGNVRELRNVIEHGAIITKGETLRIPSLEDSTPSGVPPQTMADAEREHILRVLEKTRWRIKGPKGAAAALGLNPSTLYGRMKKLGIPLRRDAAGSGD